MYRSVHAMFTSSPLHRIPTQPHLRDCMFSYPFHPSPPLSILTILGARTLSDLMYVSYPVIHATWLCPMRIASSLIVWSSPTTNWELFYTLASPLPTGSYNHSPQSYPAAHASSDHHTRLRPTVFASEVCSGSQANFLNASDPEDRASGSSHYLSSDNCHV